MDDELSIRIAGEAGQGMQTVGQALCLIFKNAGFCIFAHQDYMSRIRGGNNFFQLRISSRPIHAPRRSVDIVVALDQGSVALHKKWLTDAGLILLDRKKLAVAEDEKNFFDVPMYEMAEKIGGSEVFVNSAACGILSALIAVEWSYVEGVLKSVFSDRTDEVIRKNIEVARLGYEYAGKSGRRAFPIKHRRPRGAFVLTGNEAIALGAIRGGCKFYSGYPMTPSTGLMNTVAHFAKKFNIVVEQAEDEIAAINMALGASFAGARAMTATSGGGFALMVEGVSLSGMTETPVVIVEAQRPAPATGLPTRTEQADLDFVIHAGHGEFARVVYAPGTIEEAFYLTVKAFNIAEKYQIPVFIMTDQHLADSCRDISAFDVGAAQVRRHIISRADSKGVTNYKRYALTKSGVSPRAIPSWIEDVVYADSDEHTEEGHITESAQVRTAMVEKRLYRKMAGLRQEIERPTVCNAAGADVVLVGFGSTFGVLKEASEAAKNKKIGFVHLSQVWPFPQDEMGKALSGAGKIITVENNASGQMAGLLRRETGIKVDASILKFDGRPFDLDFLLEEIKKVA